MNIDDYKCETCGLSYELDEGTLFSQEPGCGPHIGLRALCMKCYDEEFPEGHESG